MEAPESLARPAVDPDAIRPTLAADAIERVAAYGVPPDGWLSTVAYALAVVRRRKALIALRTSAHRRFRAAKSEAEHALRQLGRAIYEQRGRVDAPGLAEALRGVDVASDEAVAADARAAGVLASVAEDEARAAAEIAAAKAELDPLRDQETKLGAQLEVAEHDHRRAEAKRQRVEIELRNLRATIAAQPALGAPGTELASKLAMLDAELSAREAEARLLAGRVSDRTSDLGRVRRELAIRVGRVAAAEEARRRVAEQAKLTAAEAGEAKSAVEAVRDAALVALGREALRLGAGRGLSAYDAAAEAERAWSERAREVALYEAAVDGFHREGFRKGLSVLGGSLALVVFALVFAALR